MTDRFKRDIEILSLNQLPADLDAFMTYLRSFDDGAGYHWRSADELWDDYVIWCADTGHRAVTQRALQNAWKALGGQTDRASRGKKAEVTGRKRPTAYFVSFRTALVALAA